MTTKQLVCQMLDRLPDDVTMHDVIAHLYLLQQVAEGNRRGNPSDVMEHDEIEWELSGRPRIIQARRETDTTRPAKTPEFHYCTGELVMEGDRVISENGNPSVIEMIVAPGTSDAEEFGCPEGGLYILEDWGGTPSHLLIEPPDGIYWEEMQFVRRKDADDGA